MSISQQAREAAEEIVSAANIVSNDGYYEIDIDAAAAVVARFEAQIRTTLSPPADELRERAGKALHDFDARIEALTGRQRKRNWDTEVPEYREHMRLRADAIIALMPSGGGEKARLSVPMSPEWCMRMAEQEVGYEIGAGQSHPEAPTPELVEGDAVERTAIIEHVLEWNTPGFLRGSEERNSALRHMLGKAVDATVAAIAAMPSPLPSELIERLRNVRHDLIKADRRGGLGYETHGALERAIALLDAIEGKAA